MFAILLQIVVTGRALATRVDHAADSGKIADFQLHYGAPDLYDPADDLVAWNHGIEGIAPIIAGLM
jgi:hypothetical protein